jgi:long-chain acyl-CoA synthetase
MPHETLHEQKSHVTLSEVIARYSQIFPEKPCIVQAEGTPKLSYGQLDIAASRFATFLAKKGLGPNSRLLIAVSNTIGFFVALIGAMRARVIAVPVDPNLASAELCNIVQHADPQILLADHTSASKVAHLLEGSKAQLITEELVWESALGQQEATVAPLPMALPDDLAIVLYTSGTTGSPKGVMHSHRTLMSRLETLREWFSFDETYRSLCLLPTHFGHGLISNCLATFNFGGTLILCRPFDLDLLRKLWGYINTYEVNWFSTVPTIVRLLLKFAERTRPISVPSLKFVTCASAPLRIEEIETFEQQFGIPLLNCYGITETAAWTAFSPRDIGRDKSSVGIAFGCDIRATDEFGNLLPPSEPGELRVRGPSVMLGYYKSEALTLEAIQNEWFRTGDYGKVDETGRVYLLGRIKDIIVRGGLNVYPSEIDAVLLGHSSVAEAYCVGVDDAILGEKIGAAVVLKEGKSTDEQELIGYCRQLLAPYKCPDLVRFVDAVAKNSRGKVNRSRLRPLFSDYE